MTDNKIIELTPFRAELTRSLARRGERLLASADPAAEVAALEPLEAYYIVRQLGLGQALPILLALTPSQLTTCVDLDCWERHDFAAESLDEWLTVFAHAGPENLARSFFSLEYGAQLLYLAKTVTVYDPDMDEVPPHDEEEGPDRAMTPDGFYLLEVKSDVTLRIHPFSVLDALYQYDQTAAWQLLCEVRVELPTQIEEEALRFRNGRMADLGFVSPDEADILFSRPAAQPSVPAQQPLDGDRGRLPSVYAGALVKESLLQEALSLITDGQCLARLEQEMVFVINGAITAYGEKTRDIEQINVIAERVRDTICLGLESLIVKEDPGSELDDTEAAAKAAALLEQWHVTDLFRHGFMATQGLRQAARQALQDPCLQAWYNLPDAEQADDGSDRLERAFFAALLGRHALRSGFDLARPEAIKAFASLADVEVAGVRLKSLVERICPPAGAAPVEKGSERS
ncbi:MAG: hypothetical protein C0613_11510 [Desulfobulbaceae bacterium]|nr:MAG: hypothetical protein C0613_11510 [Desulfobulbaceae bacterium]